MFKIKIPLKKNSTETETKEKKSLLKKLDGYKRYIILIPLLIYYTHSIINSMLFTDTLSNIQKNFFSSEEIDEVKESNSEDKNTLRVGVKENVASMCFYNKTTNKHYGLEVDLAKAISEELGYKKVHFIPVTPVDRAEMLINDEIDMAIASCTIDKSPPDGVEYSESYLKTCAKFLTMESSLIKKVSELDNKKMGAIENGVNIKQARVYLNKRMIKPIFVEYKTYDNLFNALYEGNIDSVAVDEAIANMYAEEYDDKEYGLDLKFTEHDYGILTKQNSAMSKNANNALHKIKANGVLEDIIKRWND